MIANMTRWLLVDPRRLALRTVPACTQEGIHSSRDEECTDEDLGGNGVEGGLETWVSPDCPTWAEQFLDTRPG